MITLLVCCRVEGNPDSALDRMLDSLLATTTPGNVEVVIKFDTDDPGAPQPEWFTRYPFPVKYFRWSRNEGRHSLYWDQAHLFAQHDPGSRWLQIMTDDAVFTRPGWDEELLARSEPYAIVFPDNVPVVRDFAGGRWREPELFERWRHCDVQALCPTVTTRTLEVLQNFGWQSGADNWCALLTILMYDLFGVEIGVHVPRFYRQFEIQSGATVGRPCFNNMAIDHIRDCENKYYFELVKQQCRNLYLNMKADGLLPA
jgi:hypothetical protein